MSRAPSPQRRSGSLQDQRGIDRPQGASCDIGSIEVVGISIADASIAEGNAGTSQMLFTVSVSGPVCGEIPLSVDYATADGTATIADSDYQATSGTLVFSCGQTSATIAVTINGDMKAEPDETFVVNLSNPVGARLANSQATGTIVNDDSVGISIADVSVTEGNAGTTPAVFTVTLSQVPVLPVSVNYATADGTATVSDNDYQTKSGTLTINPPQTTGTITVLVNGDLKVEPNETFLVNLSNPVNGSITRNQAIGTIVNDDASGCSQPAAITDLVIVPTVGPAGGGFNLLWSPTLAAGAGQYVVLRSSDGGSTFVQIATVKAAQAPGYAGVIGGSQGQVLVFAVRADNGCAPVSDLSNQVTLTVNGCAHPATANALGLDKTSYAAGDNYQLKWTWPGGGNSLTLPPGAVFRVLFSSDGVNFAPVDGGGSTSPTFAGQIPGTALGGSLGYFAVRVDLTCNGQVLSSDLSLPVSFVVNGPPCLKPAAAGGLTLDKGAYVGGDSYQLTWVWPAGGPPAALPAGTTFQVLFSSDGISFVPVAGTGLTTPSFTGTIPAALGVGSKAFFSVRVDTKCPSGQVSSSDTSSTVSFTVLAPPPPCDPPPAPGKPVVNPVGRTGMPAPTDFLSVSFAPSVGANRYGVRINADVKEFSTVGPSIVLPPRGTNTDPFQVFVKAYGCNPEKASAEVGSDVISLLLTPPAANFVVSGSPKAGANILFTDTSSPQATIWLWIFDDGGTDTRQSPTHTFATAGAHTVYLVASNGAGSSSTFQTVTVGAAGSSRSEPVTVRTTVPVDSDELRRQARVDLSGPGGVLLRLKELDGVEGSVYLRFLDGSGESLMERRLSIPPGGEGLYDLGAYGLKGSYRIELMSNHRYGSQVEVVGKPGVREVGR